ncbi:MAG: FUSC family protein [Pseudonocardiales bacterium]|nr:FUSC family protein [Pseudonocardiales bacterium]
MITRSRAADVLRARTERLFRRGRTPGLRTMKTTLAAVLAFVLAEWLHTSDQPILAPLTALLVVQLTMYETVAHGRERIVSVVAGVLVAVGFAHIVGLTWWSLGAVVAVSLVAGRMLRLGPHLPEVAISAMLVLAVGGAESAALGRVVETLIGAAVGVLVNLVIAPPLYIQPTRDAVDELTDRIAGYAHDLAEVLRGEWTRAAADRALDGARDLGAEVARADAGLARTEASGRLNPRGHLAREAGPQLRASLTALEHAQIGLRNLARAMLDRTYYLDEDAANLAYDADVKAALADVLDAVAVAAPAASPSQIGHDGGELLHRLDVLHHRRDDLGALLMVDPHIDPAAWQQHGALLAAIDRLRVEIAAAGRPIEHALAPARPAERHQGIRRAHDDGHARCAGGS